MLDTFTGGKLKKEDYFKLILFIIFVILVVSGITALIVKTINTPPPIEEFSNTAGETINDIVNFGGIGGNLNYTIKYKTTNVKRYTKSNVNNIYRKIDNMEFQALSLINNNGDVDDGLLYIIPKNVSDISNFDSKFYNYLTEVPNRRPIIELSKDNELISATNAAAQTAYFHIDQKSYAQEVNIKISDYSNVQPPTPTTQPLFRYSRWRCQGVKEEEKNNAPRGYKFVRLQSNKEAGLTGKQALDVFCLGDFFGARNLARSRAVYKKI